MSAVPRVALGLLAVLVGVSALVVAILAGLAILASLALLRGLRA